MKESKTKLKLAIQKKGRLTEKSLSILKDSGIDIEEFSEKLVVSAKNFPLELLFLRDDDIPEYVQDGVADIGIVGENVLYEKNSSTIVCKKLGFGKCKLLIGVPETEELKSVELLNGKRIATSYPNILTEFLNKNNITARIIQISGSVEIAPSLGIADYICDIVSSGNTLKLNKLKKSFEVYDSQAVLVKSKSNNLPIEKSEILEQLIKRIDSVLIAKNSNYLMMNAPKCNLDNILNKIPSLKSPTILPLADNSMVAIHAVVSKELFWDIQDTLKYEGASGILLLPINNMIV